MSIIFYLNRNTLLKWSIKYNSEFKFTNSNDHFKSFNLKSSAINATFILEYL